MKKMICFAVTFILMLSTFAGCTVASAGEVYGKDDKDISVGAGQAFTIQLEENPTTGYVWSVSINDEDIVILDKDTFDENPKEPVAVGAGGMRILTFKGMAKGTTTLTLVYEQSWEKKADDETLVINVTVE